MATMTVDKEKCKSCSLCVSVCPKKIIEISRTERNRKGYCPAYCTDQTQCIGCAMCYTICPDCAVTVER